MHGCLYIAILLGFVKVARWICLSYDMDLSKLFYVFLALCQTKSSWSLTMISSLLKLLLWTKCVEWVNTLGPLLVMFSYCSRGHHRHSVLYRFTAGRDCSSYHRWGWFNLQWDPISSNPIEFSGSCQKNFLQSFWPWRVWLARRHHLVLWDQTQKSLQACQRFPKLKEDTSIKFYEYFLSWDCIFRCPMVPWIRMA